VTDRRRVTYAEAQAGANRWPTRSSPQGLHSAPGARCWPGTRSSTPAVPRGLEGWRGAGAAELSLRAGGVALRDRRLRSRDGDHRAGECGRCGHPADRAASRPPLGRAPRAGRWSAGYTAGAADRRGRCAVPALHQRHDRGAQGCRAHPPRGDRQHGADRRRPALRPDRRAGAGHRPDVPRGCGVGRVRTAGVGCGSGRRGRVRSGPAGAGARRAADRLRRAGARRTARRRGGAGRCRALLPPTRSGRSWCRARS